MIRGFLICLFFSSFFYADAQFATPFEKGNGNTTATYEEAIKYYQSLDKNYKQVKVLEFGSTDAGLPLHLVLISKTGEFDVQKLKQQGKIILLINNAIHPGEPCGVDASMMLARDIISKKVNSTLLDNVVLGIIPVYNIGGTLNRSCCTRANQIGPEAQGFRGNAKNLDLNRDFIKADSKNSMTFSQIFHFLQPDIFVDTHTSNGADYQYVMTLITTQKDKLHPILSDYVTQKLEPELYRRMEQVDYPMVPYVNLRNWRGTPDSGINGFLETPRYATGYTALFNTIGFVSEAHMLKPYNERVMATYEFLLKITEIANEDHAIIRSARARANAEVMSQSVFPLNWQMDTTQYEILDFKGYQASYVPSKTSGLPVLHYDTTQPVTLDVKFYNKYIPQTHIKKPYAYIIPQAWEDVIDRLKINKIKMRQLRKDTIITVESYYIKDYSTLNFPYEGHYLHYDTDVEKVIQNIMYRTGDYVILADQQNIRFIVETLEPKAVDSYFNWNFFDPILMQKEYFSDYTFDETAAELLKADTALKEEFNSRMASDTAFASNLRQQLQFIYSRSAYAEPTFKRYPVGRLLHEMTLPLE